jgi:hypothetical protein
LAIAKFILPATLIVTMTTKMRILPMVDIRTKSVFANSMRGGGAIDPVEDPDGGGKDPDDTDG